MLTLFEALPLSKSDQSTRNLLSKYTAETNNLTGKAFPPAEIDRTPLVLLHSTGFKDTNTLLIPPAYSLRNQKHQIWTLYKWNVIICLERPELTKFNIGTITTVHLLLHSAFALAWRNYSSKFLCINTGTLILGNSRTQICITKNCLCP
jgi:hypothetical protein